MMHLDDCVKRELDDLAEKAARCSNKAALDPIAFDIINHYSGRLSRQTLIKRYYRAVTNYKEENFNG